MMDSLEKIVAEMRAFVEGADGPVTVNGGHVEDWADRLDSLRQVPEIPEPRFHGVLRGGLLVEDGYTADQMRAYAELARRGGS